MQRTVSNVTELKYVQIWRTLERIRVSLALSDSEFADILGLTRETLAAMRTKRSAPNVHHLMRLSQHLNLGFDAVLHDRIDYPALVKQFQGETTAFPEKYLTGGLSKRRTAINLLNYIQRIHGWERRNLMLRRFQMTEAMFVDPDAPISIRFNLDFLEELYRYGHDEKILIDMGKYAAITHRSAHFALTLRNLGQLKDHYERMIYNIIPNHIERNYDWSLGYLDGDRALVIGRPSEQFIGNVGFEYAHHKLGCLPRQGFLESIPLYANRPLANVKHTKCVSRGDHQCEFEVDFNDHQRAGTA